METWREDREGWSTRIDDSLTALAEDARVLKRRTHTQQNVIDEAVATQEDLAASVKSSRKVGEVASASAMAPMRVRKRKGCGGAVGSTTTSARQALGVSKSLWKSFLQYPPNVMNERERKLFARFFPFVFRSRAVIVNQVIAGQNISVKTTFNNETLVSARISVLHPARWCISTVHLPHIYALGVFDRLLSMQVYPL